MNASNDLGFVPTGAGNYVLRRDGFTISYNPNTSAPGGFAMFAGDGGGGEETAICTPRSCYILNGDFRKAYAEAPNLDACLAIYRANPRLHSSWTDPLPEQQVGTA